MTFLLLSSISIPGQEQGSHVLLLGDWHQGGLRIPSGCVFSALRDVRNSTMFLGRLFGRVHGCHARMPVGGRQAENQRVARCPLHANIKRNRPFRSFKGPSSRRARVMRSVLCAVHWRTPNRPFVTLIGPSVDDQKVWPAYAARQGQCENKVCVLKLLTHWSEGNQFGRAFQEISGSREDTNAGVAARHYQC